LGRETPFPHGGQAPLFDGRPFLASPNKYTGLSKEYIPEKFAANKRIPRIEIFSALFVRGFFLLDVMVRPFYFLMRSAPLPRMNEL